MEFHYFEKRPIPENTVVPFNWGDIVAYGKDQSREIITLPDTGLGEAATVELQAAENGKVSWPATREWKDLTFEASASSLSLEMNSPLSRYRAGLVINSIKYYTGLQLFSGDNDLFFEYLRGDSSLRDQILADLGGQQLLKRFWTGSLTQWRVFVHRRCSWEHWEIVGPTSWKMRAVRAFDNLREEAENSRPRRIRHGVYRNEGEINSILLYHGLDLVTSFSTLVGQGFPELPSESQKNSSRRSK